MGALLRTGGLWAGGLWTAKNVFYLQNFDSWHPTGA